MIHFFHRARKGILGRANRPAKPYTNPRGEWIRDGRQRGDARRALCHAASLAVESLESRQLLCGSGGAFQLDDTLFRDDTDTGGMSISTYGDFIAVGLPLETRSVPGGAPQEGVVKLIDRASGAVLREITNPDSDTTLDEFGASVAFLANGTLLVGAPGDAADTGTAWVMNVHTNTFVYEVENPDASNQFFGDKVFAYRNRPVVHSSFSGFDVVDGFINYGVLDVFTHDAVGGVAHTNRLVSGAPPIGAYDFFGESVAVHGDTLAIGAQNLNRVYIYNDLADNTADTSITESDYTGTLAGAFGSSLAFAADGSLAVGARGGIEALGFGDVRRGAAYVVNPARTSAVRLRHPDASSDPDPLHRDTFGTSVSIAGNQLAVGAPGSREAFVYDLTQSATAVQLPQPTVGQFGTHVAFAGNDLVVGADTGQFGGVFIYRAGTAATPPTAVVGGPYAGNEGGSISFDASASTGCGDLSFEWDLDYDGTFDPAPDLTSPSFSHPFHDNTSRNVAVRVTNAAGLSDINSTTLTVTNVAPTAIASATNPGTTLAAYTLTLGATDPSSVDQAAGFTYLVDWGDGTIDDSTSHLYADGGVYTITVVATDKDLESGPPVTLTARITGTTADGDNVVYGNDADEQFTLTPGSVIVARNGVTVATFTNGNPITFDLAGGNDSLTTAPGITTPLNVLGGAGNDTITGGAGNDTIDGGAGDNELFGGGGNDSFASSFGEITFTGPGAVARREFATYVAAATGSIDAPTFVVRNADGIDIDGGEGSPFQTQFPSTGQYTVTVTLTDGTDSTQITIPVSVSIISLRDGILHAGARAGGSKIDARRDGSGNLKVTVDGVTTTLTAAQTASVNRIALYGSDASDDLTINALSSLFTEIYGFGGNDKLKGGGGHDIIVGGDGDDAIIGNSGRDLLVGGAGADRIIGNSDDDILVAGTTAYDRDPEALRAILETWADPSLPALLRVLMLKTGVGTDGNVRLSACVNAYEDDARDVITGSSGADWFFFNDDDQVTDLHWWEFTDLLHLIDPGA